MKKHVSKFAPAIIFFTAGLAQATPPCPDKSVERRLEQSTTVVVAEIITTSDKKIGKDTRRTIQWQVLEAWKGPHNRYKMFTTRTNYPYSDLLDRHVSDPVMLLFLAGTEPYSFDDGFCLGSKRLVSAFDDMKELYRIEPNRKDYVPPPPEPVAAEPEPILVQSAAGTAPPSKP